jgi:hypothetical protein
VSRLVEAERVAPVVIEVERGRQFLAPPAVFFPEIQPHVEGSDGAGDERKPGGPERALPGGALIFVSGGSGVGGGRRIGRRRRLRLRGRGDEQQHGQRNWQQRRQARLVQYGAKEGAQKDDMFSY